MNKIAFLLLLLITSWGGQNKCGSHAPPEYKRIFDLPGSQQEGEFKKLPLDKQVDMYIYAMYSEPPDKIYVDYLASNGKDVIPHLLRRIEDEKGDYARTALVHVFRDMHRKYYNLRDEPEIIATLKRESAKIRDDLWREESENYVKYILEQPGITKH